MAGTDGHCNYCANGFRPTGDRSRCVACSGKKTSCNFKRAGGAF
jgi:hypothetical protein